MMLLRPFGRDAQSSLTKTEDGPKDVVEVVRDATCERSHCFKAFGLHQTSLEAKHLFLLLLHMGDISDRADHPIGGAAGVTKNGSTVPERAYLGSANKQPDLLVVTRSLSVEVRSQRGIDAFELSGAELDEALPLCSRQPLVAGRDVQHLECA